MRGLKNRVRAELFEAPQTVPSLCKILNIDDQFKIMHAIAELKNSDEIILIGFDKFYEPDGCAGYLARYGRRA